MQALLSEMQRLTRWQWSVLWSIIENVLERRHLRSPNKQLPLNLTIIERVLCPMNINTMNAGSHVIKLADSYKCKTSRYIYNRLPGYSSLIRNPMHPCAFVCGFTHAKPWRSSEVLTLGTDQSLQTVHNKLLVKGNFWQVEQVIWIEIVKLLQ